ncbi:Probable ornithine aminotransferase [Mycobacteroides abscessus]|nr:Probable ornithine aminotransferase [Mycobacteroides abscessus]
MDRISSASAQWFGPDQVQVRGRGLLIGIEFTDASIVGDLLIELISNNIIVNHSLNSDHVLRLTPPAVITDDDVEFLVQGYLNAIEQVAIRAKAALPG